MNGGVVLLSERADHRKAAGTSPYPGVGAYLRETI